jgi:hypothetical protein
VLLAKSGRPGGGEEVFVDQVFENQQIQSSERSNQERFSY